MSRKADDPVVRLHPEVGQEHAGRLSSLRRLADLSHLLVALDPRFEVASALVFATVAASSRPMTGIEVRQITALSKSAVSRYLQTLSTGQPTASGARSEGLGLIKVSQHPVDGRALLYAPSPAGERLAHRMVNVLYPERTAP